MRMADTPNDPDTGCSSEPKSSGAGSGHSRRGQRRSGPQLSGARHRRRAGPRVLPNREPANIAIACLPSPPFGGRSRSTGRYAALFSNPYTTSCIVPVDARGIDDALLDGCRTAAALMLSRCGRHGQRPPRPGRFGRMSACPTRCIWSAPKRSCWRGRRRHRTDPSLRHRPVIETQNASAQGRCVQ
jgi:hypothetical protein